MSIVFDFDIYWFCVAAILASLGGFWGFKRVKSLLTGR